MLSNNLDNLIDDDYWCRWSDSNRHVVRHTILSRACLPVPPQRQKHIDIF